jgi:hypothetical protein
LPIIAAVDRSCLVAHVIFDFYGGIDFSGAREPLSNLWTALGREDAGRLHILSLRPHAFRADLLTYVREGWRSEAGPSEQRRSLWGADFPFGLPLAALAQLPLRQSERPWDALLAWVADRPPEEVRAALSDRQRATRSTDRGGALPPLDLRLYKQTLEGLRWLHELREDEEIAVLPQAPVEGATTVLIEVYPSAAVRELGLPRRRQPGRPAEGRARAAALRPYLSFASPCLEAIAATLEDAWDATIACLNAWSCRAELDSPLRAAGPAASAAAIEGWIYLPPGTTQ